jgi:protein TonB
MRAFLTAHAATLAFAPAAAGMRLVGPSRLPHWLPALLLVTLTHAGVWYGVTHGGGHQTPPKPLPAVQVALITHLPPEQRSTPLQRQTKAAMRKPAPPAVAPPVQAVEPDAPATPQQTQPMAAGDDYVEPIFTAAYLNNPPPAYPLAARRRGMHGTAIIRAQVLENGDCRHAGVKKSSGHPLLDQAALDAVKQWRFVPARRGAQTQVAWVEVPITFKLSNTPD